MSLKLTNIKMDMSELAKMAGVSRPTIYSWKKKGVLESELAKKGIRLDPDVKVDDVIYNKEGDDKKDISDNGKGGESTSGPVCGEIDIQKIAKKTGLSEDLLNKWAERGELASLCAVNGIDTMGKSLPPDKGSMEEWLVNWKKSKEEKEGEIIATPAPWGYSYAIRRRDVDGSFWLESVPPTSVERKWREERAKECMKEINERFGPGTLVRGSEGFPDIKCLKTGIPELDSILGKGVPQGRMMEIFGREGTGKTTLALHIASSAQKEGIKVAYLDAEQTMDKNYAQSIGLDIESIYVSQSNGMEETLEELRDICRKGAYQLVIVDSVAALQPTGEYEGLVGDANMGLKARLMSQICRMLPGDMNDNQVTVIFINQIRTSIASWGAPEFTPGGHALKFGASIRLSMKLLSEKDKTESRQVEITCVKNKVAIPYNKCVLKLEYGKGFITN